MFVANTNSIRKIKNLLAMDKCRHKCEKGGIFPLKYFTIFDGFMAYANTLFYIYDGRMFVTNNNTIKYIFFVFLTHKSSHKC